MAVIRCIILHRILSSPPDNIIVVLGQERIRLVRSHLNWTWSCSNIIKCALLLKRIVLNSDTSFHLTINGPGWRAHSLPIMERLHWLPVEHRIRFKIATLTFRALHQNNPPYLHDLISRYTPARTLRSTDKYLLNTKRINTKIGSRAFSAAAPETWNALPTYIKLTDSLNKFKIDLKTHLFRIAFK